MKKGYLALTGILAAGVLSASNTGCAWGISENAYKIITGKIPKMCFYIEDGDFDVCTDNLRDDITYYLTSKQDG